MYNNNVINKYTSGGIIILQLFIDDTHSGVMRARDARRRVYFTVSLLLPRERLDIL